MDAGCARWSPDVRVHHFSYLRELVLSFLWKELNVLLRLIANSALLNVAFRTEMSKSTMPHLERTFRLRNKSKDRLIGGLTRWDGFNIPEFDFDVEGTALEVESVTGPVELSEGDEVVRGCREIKYTLQHYIYPRDLCKRALLTGNEYNIVAVVLLSHVGLGGSTWFGIAAVTALPVALVLVKIGLFLMLISSHSKSCRPKLILNQVASIHSREGCVVISVGIGMVVLLQDTRNNWDNSFWQPQARGCQGCSA
ncbi:hypothetical protein K438DRAFT_1771603 [Mycena galopus ATCC 62051]|nr:hypothetical protein K438DRAFT_1771603 [Mycena galopus ATCC 62051]